MIDTSEAPMVRHVRSESSDRGPARALASLHRTDQFVGRTTNWLYDHLRLIPRYRVAVFADGLENRDEYPLLQASDFDRWSFKRRVWRKIVGDRFTPGDWWRLKRLGPRVLHSHFGYVAADDLPLQQRLDVPWLVSFYGADVWQLGERPEWIERYRRIFDRATWVLALGPVMAGRLVQLGCSPEKIAVHRLGVDVAGLPSRPRVVRAGEPLRVLCAGTFREKKGFVHAVRAVALLREAGVPVKLHFVGDEAGKPGDQETKQAVFREIRRHRLDDIASHTSFVSYRRLVEVALASHVFLAPSVTASDGDAEGTPFVLQQMMATAMPCIATKHSDVPYVFGECRDLLVPERDASAIAQRLQHYAENPDAVVSDGLAQSQRIRRSFDARECAGRLADLYDGVHVGRKPEAVPMHSDR